MLFRFQSPHLLIAALCGVGLIAAIAGWRPIGGSLASKLLALLALLLWALAAGGLHWRVAKPQIVLVMVDNSSSTRTAAYRQDSPREQRIKQLLGDLPFRTVIFEERGGETVFSPPPAAAILLFSDCHFDVPDAAPPTYPVIDPELEQPIDAAVNRLSIRGHQLVADVSITGPPRQLTLYGTTAGEPITVAGRMIIVRPLAPGASVAFATFSAGDAWPENDTMSIPIAPGIPSEQWWIGDDAPAGFRTFRPGSLPVDSSAYLAPGVVVLNDEPAGAFTSEQLERVTQYVRDLGGGLVILGGKHAFAAGDYLGTPLDHLSPLSSAPPSPETQWIILVDSSGSMAGNAQWQTACNAVAQLLHHLPENDSVLLGSFAEQLTWWNAPTDVRTAQKLSIPPADVAPHGPTNLQEALQSMIEKTPQAGSLTRQLLLITDADVQIDNATNLASAMKAASIRLNLLAIGHGRGLDLLHQIAAATAGHVIEPSNPEEWTSNLQSLSRSALPNGFPAAGFKIDFLPPLRVPARVVDRWNRTWIKADATALANVSGQSVHPAAMWQAGSGKVIAAAFAASSTEAIAMANQLAQPPTDPRFSVRWDVASKLTVTVNALDGSKYLNDERFTLKLQRADFAPVSRDIAIPQSGPGRYELTVDAPRDGGFASVEHESRILSRTALPSRYPPEFDAIGNDHAAMHTLADRTGGQVIDTRQTNPIHFHWPETESPLDSCLAVAGALFIGFALIHDRARQRRVSRQ